MIGFSVKQVSKRFEAPGGSEVVALESLSLEIDPGEFVVVVGPNGSGKSTLLNLIAGRERPDTGRIFAKLSGGERDWLRISPGKRSVYIARIHQDPSAGTAADLSVAEHLRLATLERLPAPFGAAISGRMRQAFAARLEPVGLASRLDVSAGDLSHGQRQLLGLEMAAMRRAQLLVLDEPTASLDRKNASFCMRRIQEFHEELRATVLLVTHDMADAAQFGQRLIVLKDGRLHADLSGPKKAALRPEDVFRLAGFDVAVPAQAL